MPFGWIHDIALAKIELAPLCSMKDPALVVDLKGNMMTKAFNRRIYVTN
jgi:hypothetical protein